MSLAAAPRPHDLKTIVTSNRLVGIWRLMRGHRATYAWANLSLGVAAIARVGSYLLLGHFVDTVLGNEAARGSLPVLALGFILLAVVQGASTFVSGKLAAQTAEGVVRGLRNYLYDHIQRLPFSYHDQTPTGELIQRSTSDVDALRRFFADQAIGVGRILLLFVVNFAVLLALNVRLALLSVIAVPVIVVTSAIFSGRCRRRTSASRSRMPSCRPRCRRT